MSNRSGAVRAYYRTCAAAAALILFFVLLALAPAARAVPYVVYYHTYGEWSVVCWRGLTGVERSCYIDAPMIAFNTSSRDSAMRITTDSDGQLIVTVFSRSGTQSGAHVRLAVDGQNVAEGDPDTLDRVIWAGAQASALIERLGAGRELDLYLSDPDGHGLGREQIALAGFKDAYNDYRRELARLTKTAPPQPGPPDSSPTKPARTPAAPAPSTPAPP